MDSEVLATHSPIVVASCKDENLILLNPKEESKYKKSLQGWQVDDVLEEIMQTGNRSPETMKQLEQLKELSYKKKRFELTSHEQKQYEMIKKELRKSLPENDIAIEEVAMMSIYDMIKEKE